MKLNKIIRQIKSDLYRLAGKNTLFVFLKYFVFGESFQFIFWMRIVCYMRYHIFLRYTVLPFAYIFYRHYSYKYGISISSRTQIGDGFYIGHYGCIIVSYKAIIGKNCNISQGVTIGVSNRGSRAGCPVIGDNVYIGPGAKIFGAIIIGDNVAIGANAVVTRDVPSNSVVVGAPAKVISNEGSLGYINNIDY